MSKIKQQFDLFPILFVCRVERFILPFYDRMPYNIFGMLQYFSQGFGSVTIFTVDPLDIDSPENTIRFKKSKWNFIKNTFDNIVKTVEQLGNSFV